MLCYKSEISPGCPYVGLFLCFNVYKVEFSLNCKQYTCLVVLRELLLFVGICWVWNFLSCEL